MPKRLFLFVLAAVFMFSPFAGAAEPLTMHDVARLRSVTSAEISPQGRWIAYTLSVPRRPAKDEDGAAWSELHVVDANGQSRPFVTGEVNVSKIAWTPDGRGISFLAKRNKDKHASLYVIPVNGGEARRLIGHSTAISAYDWSPDGRRVAFLAKEPEPKEEKKWEEQGFKAEIYEENLRNVQVWLAEAKFDSDQEPQSLQLDGSASEVHFSPDGSRLVLALAPTPLIDHYYMYRRLKVVDPESGKVVTSINNPGKLGPVAWSPDGKRVAFCSGEDINDPSEGRLMVASAESGEFRELMPDYLPNVAEIAWVGPNRIRFTAFDSCDTVLGEVDAGGGKPTFLADKGGPIFTSLSTSAAGSAMVASRPTHPPEVYRFADGSPKRLTNSNPWLDEKSLAPQEVVRYEAGDGERIEGVLIRPLKTVDGKRYPLIVTVHGGPESQISNGWVTRYSYPGQVAAGEGFAVFYPNYRGSTGRGVAFAKAHQGDYGGKEFNDIVDGVDYLIDQGLVDKKKVGVTGGSYGGFASAWCATYHSERFAASVMSVGISNQISKSGTTDIADEMFLVHARKRVWEDWQFFLERSPIFYVEKARTPILILHGKDDPRVHPGQSLELYRHLKTLDKAPVRLVLYPGEGHGNRKAAARLDYSLRLMRWMKHYLQGPGGDPPANQLDYGLELPQEDSETSQ